MTLGIALSQPGATAQDPDTIDLERSSLIYSIGQVEHVERGEAMIDMGDVHTLSPAPEMNQLAVFRATFERYVPVGTLTVIETTDITARTEPDPRTRPERGDLVIFVRELSQLKPPRRYRDDFIRIQLVKTAMASHYSQFRQNDVARVLREYSLEYPRWSRSRATIAGFLNGPSWSGGREKRLEPLLNYIGILREHYKEGRTSLSAAGRKWQDTASVLFGKTAHQQHKASLPVANDPNFVPPQRPSDRDIRRLVDQAFLQFSREQRNVLSYLVATMLEHTPRSEEVWLQHQLLQSQFPEMADDDTVVEHIQSILQRLQDNQ